MFKKIWQSIKENIQELDRKTILIYALVFLVASLLLGVLIRFLGENIGATINGKSWSFRPKLFIEPLSWIMGLMKVVVLPEPVAPMTRA